VEISYKSFAQKLNNEITCPTLKEMIFGMPNLRGRDLKGIDVLNRLLNTAFILTFIKYYHNKKEKSEEERLFNSTKASNVFDLLKSIFKGNNFGLPLINHVLTEMQEDVSIQGNESYFSNIISSSENTMKIPIFKDLIKTWLTSARCAEDNEEFLLQRLLGLCNTLIFLYDLEILEKKEDNSDFNSVNLRLKSTNELFDTSYFLIRSKVDGRYWFLYSIENESNKYKVVYCSLDGLNYHNEIFELNVYQKLKLDIFE